MKTIFQIDFHNEIIIEHFGTCKKGRAHQKNGNKQCGSASFPDSA